MGLALAVWFAAGCAQEPFTEVVLTIDLQPRARESADVLEVRVWNHERDTVVLSEVVPVSEGPLTLPLHPVGGDAARTYLVEVVARDTLGDLVAVGRVEGGYVADQRLGALLCLQDDCLGETCGDGGVCDPGACETCAGPSATCQPATAELLPLALVEGCPAPSCVPTADIETRCADGLDDDCNGAIDCADEVCDNIPCERPGFACQAGECQCRQAEICDNGLNDDCDDAIDCADEDCFGEVCDSARGLRCNRDTLSCSACEGTGEVCDNGVDDDCDGFADCEDPDCCTESRCEGQRCRGADNLMCCSGGCVRIDVSERCGACGVRCPERSDGTLRSCLAYLIDPAQPEPTWLCGCNQGAGCRGDMVCERRFDRLRCGCREDSDCGTGLQCRRTGPSRHNWCRPYPL